MEAHPKSPDAATTEDEHSNGTPTLKRAVRSVAGGGQIDLFDAKRRTPGSSEPRRRVGFVDPDPGEIFIGTTRLDEYLKTAGLGWVLMVRDVLRKLDWTELEARYRLTGRSPYAPAAMMGLVLYGTMSGVSSLRGLEEVARVNLGAMWLTGGICPDHACLGRFINRHEESLTDSFFEQLTRHVLKRLGSKATQLAGDGTIVEAAASRYQTIKREAARQAAQEAAAKAQDSPDDEQLQQKAAHAQEVADAIEARAKVRSSRGAKAEKTRGTKTEPEAPILKTKQGLFRPAYTPSALANSDRIIVAQYVDPTSERAAVAPMLDQADRITGNVETLLLDGNYACGPVLSETFKRDVDILTPPPSPKKKGDKTTDASPQTDQFTKQDFTYDEKVDRFICPNGELLKPGSRREDKRRGTPYWEYRAKTKSCRACPLRNRCIGGKTQKYRKVKRYETDELMTALRMVMAQPNARKTLRKRGQWVEPVFSELRGAQGLNRFKRFGLSGARIEFAIHACAYNLRRLRAALWALCPLFFALLKASIEPIRRLLDPSAEEPLATANP